MHYRAAALEMLSKRIRTRHAEMPLSAKIGEKLGQILPMIQSHGAPQSLASQTPAGKASRYRNAIALYAESNSFLANLKLDIENESKWLKPQQQQELASVAAAVSSVLSNVLIETRNYLERNQQDA